MNMKVSILLVVALFISGFINQTVVAADLSSNGLMDRLNKRVDNTQLGEPRQYRNNEQGIPVGQFQAIFDGVDLKNRAIWLNDYRYKLYPGYKAIDKRLRSINLSSIPLGGEVVVIIEENPQEPMIPYLVKLRYKK